LSGGALGHRLRVRAKTTYDFCRRVWQKYPGQKYNTPRPPPVWNEAGGFHFSAHIFLPSIFFSKWLNYARWPEHIFARVLAKNFGRSDAVSPPRRLKAGELAWAIFGARGY